MGQNLVTGMAPRATTPTSHPRAAAHLARPHSPSGRGRSAPAHRPAARGREGAYLPPQGHAGQRRRGAGRSGPGPGRRRQGHGACGGRGGPPPGRSPQTGRDAGGAGAAVHDCRPLVQTINVLLGERPRRRGARPHPPPPPSRGGEAGGAGREALWRAPRPSNGRGRGSSRAILGRYDTKASNDLARLTRARPLGIVVSADSLGTFPRPHGGPGRQSVPRRQSAAGEEHGLRTVHRAGVR